jgi:hypothetical protein
MIQIAKFSITGGRGTGKTTNLINVLESCSENGIPCLLIGLDFIKDRLRDKFGRNVPFDFSTGNIFSTTSISGYGLRSRRYSVIGIDEPYLFSQSIRDRVPHDLRAKVVIWAWDHMEHVGTNLGSQPTSGDLMNIIGAAVS